MNIGRKYLLPGAQRKLGEFCFMSSECIREVSASEPCRTCDGQHDLHTIVCSIASQSVTEVLYSGDVDLLTYLSVSKTECLVTITCEPPQTYYTSYVHWLRELCI